MTRADEGAPLLKVLIHEMAKDARPPKLIHHEVAYREAQLRAWLLARGAVTLDLAGQQDDVIATGMPHREAHVDATSDLWGCLRSLDIEP